MEKIIGIYKITSPKKRVYIGQSIDIYKRWKSYKNLTCFGQRRLYNSLKKHGVGKHTFEIIHVCNECELNELEKYYVDLFQTFNNVNGLNIRDGGGSRGAFSAESKKLLSQKRLSLNIKYDDEYKQRMSVKLSGENNPMYGTIGELSPNWGKKHKTSTIEKMKLNHLSKKEGYKNPLIGIPNTEVQKQKAKITKIQNRIKKHGYYMFFYNDIEYKLLSFLEISKVFGVNQSSIYKSYKKTKSFRGIEISLIK